MKCSFLYLGKTRDKYLDAAISDYAARLHRFVQVEIIILKERCCNKTSDEVVKRKEADMLLDRCEKKSFKVALDLSGRQYDSVELAHLIQGWQDHGLQTVSFLIGGHVGLHHSVVNAADVIWSLSRLTFTHEMSRMIVMEQLYRACTINAGQQYHK